jgi:hypothetical protein
MSPPRVALKEQVRASITSQISRTDPSSLSFLFSPQKRGYLDRKTLLELWHEAETLLENLSDKDEEVWDDLKAVLFPETPYDLKIIENIQALYDFFPEGESSVLLQGLIAKIVLEVLSPNYPPVSPQLFIELLNFLLKLHTEFLIIIEPLSKVVLGKNPALKRGVKTLACAVLISHFEVETLFIFCACHPSLREEEKQILFQSLSAYQTIYRKFLELQEEIGDKDQISRNWFGEDYDHLKKRHEYRDSFSNLVTRFIGFLRQKNKKEALQVGRFLVLRNTNEDILRLIHSRIQLSNLKDDLLLTTFIYRQIYNIMQDFRREYISPEVREDLFQVFSGQQSQALESMGLITIGKVPAYLILQGLPSEDRTPLTYPLKDTLRDRLAPYNLTALFDLHPIPLLSQEILYQVGQIAESLELKKEELVTFISYLERLLVFLQQLEEMNIPILIGPRYGLILNAFQMNSLSLIREGAYFASTGYWLRTRVPPSLIRCISPHAIPNCLGVLDRHIFSRISPLTGAFRGTPFDLDSTNRYDWDEEAETCQIRPGYFIVEIPASLLHQWEQTQGLQKEALQEKIKQKEWS